jgi:hypothetical protein
VYKTRIECNVPFFKQLVASFNLDFNAPYQNILSCAQYACIGAGSFTTFAKKTAMNYSTRDVRSPSLGGTSPRAFAYAGAS